MKPVLLFLYGIFCVATLSAQETDVAKTKLSPQQILDSTAKAELQLKLTAINTLIDQKHTNDDKIKLLLLDLKNTELDSLEKIEKETQLDSLQKLVKKDDETIISKCSEFEKHKEYLLTFGKIDKEILSEFSDRSCRLYGPAPEKEIDYTKFIIIGDNKPIEAAKLLENETTKKALTDIFNIDSKTNLGTFEIAGDMESINLYVEKDLVEDPKKLDRFKNTQFTKDSADRLITVETAIDTSNATYEEVPKVAYFKSVQIELLEGGIVDARLVLQSSDGKTHFYFEGTDPVSILNYSRKASRRAIFKFSHYVSFQGQPIYNEEALRKLVVKYADVIDYHPNAGSNYVPDDVSYTFPSNEDDEEAKITDRRSYQVINNNHLQHVLDLRTYTDMLGLFGDEANGLFQIEGKADFFINPFNIPREAIYYFKKISPYVRYSRFDEDEDFITATLNTGTSEYSFSNNKLELLERSTLEMGLEMNILTFRLVKESPFWISFNTPLTYNVTRIQTDATTEKSNFKTLGYGANVMLDIKRFNNFGLSLGYELKGYSYLGDYSDVNLTEPSFLKTQAVKAEIFYYPGLDKSQSVFLRMKSIKDVSSGTADSFFQLQVGYRFTLGVGAVKAK